jgi:hypothetical protein
MAVDLLLFLTIDDRHRPLFATLPRQIRARTQRIASRADIALLQHQPPAIRRGWDGERAALNGPGFNGYTLPFR